MKQNLQMVFSLPQHLFYRKSIADKHIVRTFQQRAVQVNIRIRIQPFQNQQGSIPRELLIRHIKSSFINPVLILYPLHFLLIHPIKWIGQLIMRNQILMYRSGHRSRQPFVPADLGELPSLIKTQTL